ncbi:2OG-Fe(II) oxygenase [Micromonospora sp. DT233]|uniref:2OG-Fe(II) oxygenase n=1 Tax=Micromonospora sp. DT233 TaxID=3393432 RepID=UPI003CF437C0
MKIDATMDNWRRTATRFISQPYLTAERGEELNEWYRSGTGGPLTLPDFLDEEFARSLGRALREHPYWRRHTTAYDGDLRSYDVPERDWADNPARAARHYQLQPLVQALEAPEVPAELRAVLKRFVAFAITGPYLLSWVSSVIGESLEQRTSFEFTRYGPGDQITPHHDLLPGRVLAANFYLDELYHPSAGGRLWFRAADGTEHVATPTFNSLTLIPIRVGCVHWVEPYTAEIPGRYTANLQIHRDY